MSGLRRAENSVARRPCSTTLSLAGGRSQPSAGACAPDEPVRVRRSRCADPPSGVLPPVAAFPSPRFLGFVRSPGIGRHSWTRSRATWYSRRCWSSILSIGGRLPRSSMTGKLQPRIRAACSPHGQLVPLPVVPRSGVGSARDAPFPRRTSWPRWPCVRLWLAWCQRGRRVGRPARDNVPVARRGPVAEQFRTKWSCPHEMPIPRSPRATTS